MARPAKKSIASGSQTIMPTESEPNAKGAFSPVKTRSLARPQVQNAANPRKRKLDDLGKAPAPQASSKPAAKPSRVESDATTALSPPTKKSKKKKNEEEKRLKRFRKKAPQSFLEKLERAQTQRMIVLNRTRSEVDGYPKEDIDIVGSTGNIYTVTVDKVTSCTCPDSMKGNECKHKVYALHTVLKAPYHLQFQLAFLSDELRDIFQLAPPIPTDVGAKDEKDGNRKSVEGECPICYMDLDEKENELVWCKAACGNNIHKSCFEQWVASQRGSTVKCVYCRTAWEMDGGDLATIQKSATMSEGYRNVADHFGMSRARDYSSYHQPWVRRTFGMGW